MTYTADGKRLTRYNRERLMQMMVAMDRRLTVAAEAHVALTDRAEDAETMLASADKQIERLMAERNASLRDLDATTEMVARLRAAAQADARLITDLRRKVTPLWFSVVGITGWLAAAGALAYAVCLVSLGVLKWPW